MERTSALIVLEAQADIPALNASLRTRGAGRAERHRMVIEELRSTAARTQGPLIRELELRAAAGQIEGFTPYWIANIIAIRGTRAAIEELAGHLDVEVIEPDVKPILMEPVHGIPSPTPDKNDRGIGVTPGVRAVRGPEVWYELGIDGTGALVANMDTGVDGSHPALASRWRGYNGQEPWQECWLDVIGGSSQFPFDNNSHGTHVMGTMCGLGAATQDTIGVAWGAKWIACNAINQGVGPAFDNDVITCFQWLADPDGNPNTVDDVPDVVQNSWRINEGFGYNYTDCDTRWWNAIDNCEASGVVVTFSAGNEGPGAQTIGSPPDRATTPYNVFSVGAVDATHYDWPYPIASFSSRGPTGCAVPAPLKLKPEVVAPGVTVYSSVPGGGYQQNYWDGTSMAGPHVAGTVALMRSANPDIDVESIKQILFDTARDEGAVGEDNTYGYGFIDAYEAVLQCLTGYGTLAGQVTNASNGGTIVDAAHVRLTEIDREFVADASGQYSGLAPEGSYTVEVSHPSFATLTVPGIQIIAGQVSTADFALTDNAGPAIESVSYPSAVTNPNDPIPITALISDYSEIASVELTWRVDGGAWTMTPMSLNGFGLYEASIAGQPIGSIIEFYLEAADIAANTTVDPPTAPTEVYEILVTLAFFIDDVESDGGWSLALPADATNGRWVRMDPYGTEFEGTPVEPSDDHTDPPGAICFVTGAGTPGGPASGSDVDGGCVTLTSPRIDLSGAEVAILSYWRWFAHANGLGASFEVLATNNDGFTWVPLESFGSNANEWTFKSFDLADYFTLTNQMRFRFKACDLGIESLVEAAIDDVVIQGIPSGSSGVDPLAARNVTTLFANRPNPFTGETLIRFRLASAGAVDLAVFDPAGRRVRTLVAGERNAGDHQASWDGRDDLGHPAAAGVYFYELRTEDAEVQRKMLRLK